MKTLFFISFFCAIFIVPAFTQCLDDQKSLLLELRNSLIFNLSTSTRLVHWNHTKDCCNWEGVECDVSGHVTSLQLDNEMISGGIENSEYLFNLNYLEVLNLAFNRFNGIQIPKGLSNLANLTRLNLSNAGFAGQIPSVHMESRLFDLDLSSNQLQGEIPNWIWEIGNGSVTFLNLSHNLLSGFQKPYKFPSPLFPIPRLLDLSSNQLKGEIPNWFWQISNGVLRYLNLSNNLLHGFQKPYIFPSISIIDLHSNQFQGELLPIPHMSTIYVDYSYNHFTNSIPNDFGFLLYRVLFFSVSNNNLTGEIPSSICRATSLQVLDLSANTLTGSIPPCLLNNSDMQVLILGSNNLSGTIPDTFSVNCSLRTLDTNKNVLEGKIPGSLVNCPSLEVLNIGHNRFEGTFPCMLMKTQLRVLVLRSNKFYGDLQCLEANQEWSNLQIIDISTNNFNTNISLLSFSKWRGMVSANQNKQNQHNYLRLDLLIFAGYYYQDTVIVTMKGLEMELTKILLVFTSIDFSNNKFYGEIPYSIGDLKSLYGLNLSHNELTGSIPASIGNLAQLGSLDLSMNRLTGKIPMELASLTSIGFLNLSYNRLFGKIPEGTQLQTFSAASFEGNLGLYGCPIDVSCNNKRSGGSTQGFQNGEIYSKKEINWDYVSAALGFVVGFGSTIWLLLHCQRLKEMYFGKVDQILLKLFRKC